MKIAAVAVVALASLGACNISTSSDPDEITPDAAVAQPDAPPAHPPEPKPAFTAGMELGGQLAIDDVGIREQFTYQNAAYLSVVTASLTDPATPTKSCGVTLGPKFVQFG